MPLSAARTDLGAVGSRAVCGRAGGDLDRLVMARGRSRTVELQQKPGAGRLLAPGMVPQAEVADLVQAPGATHEIGVVEQAAYKDVFSLEDA